MPPTIGQYLKICRDFELEFDRNRRLHGARIRCRRGCSDCCHQLFQITEVEAAWISYGSLRLSPELRARLVSKAELYLEARRCLVSLGGEPEAWGSLPSPGARLACPALEDGACSIYEYRPLICRKFGIPLYNPDKPGRVFACELNFRNGEAIDDPHLVQIQSAIHHEWKQVQIGYNEAGGYRDSHPITVARAILEDFSHCIEPAAEV
ncbi:MAG: YkgJ family cysteine cluster protein [Bryobacterales bacterium]|nr:YkgJ family cysteine cluster protein [Bryobacterales bacterium]